MADETAVKEAVALLETGRSRDALARLEALLDEDPEDATCSYWAARACRELGELEEAVDHLYLAAHHAPSQVVIWQTLAEVLQDAGRPAEAEEALRQAEKRAPDSAGIHLQLGSMLKSQERLDEALAHHRKAVLLEPKNAQLRATLGLTLLRSGRLDEAARECGRARELDKVCVEAWHNGGLIERERGSISVALAMFRQALALRPDSPEIRSALAHALRDAGREEEALAHYDAVLATYPRFVDALLNRALLLLRTHRWAQGWDQYEARFLIPGAAPPWLLPRWSGEHGAAVLVHWEQGIGDQIMFASCVPDLQRCSSAVTLTCNDRLVPLFSRSFPGVRVVFASQSAHAAGATVMAPIGSLPRFFRRSSQAFPQQAGFLRADEARTEAWRLRFASLGGKRHVGLSWRGGTVNTRGHLRSIDLEAISTLSRADVTWVSVQYGANAQSDAEKLRAAGLSLARWPEIETDLDECAAALAALDLVVTIDNSIAHLAGALGVPAWILLPPGPEWRYGARGKTMPWYPRARLFRRENDEVWEHALRCVLNELEAAH